MRKAAAQGPSPITGQAVVRVLISLYFIALGAGLISGTEPAILLYAFLPALPAKLLAGALFVTLASCILIGFKRRHSALLLAIVMFWSSYVVMLALPPAQDLGGFWRDLALIGGLILTYADTTDADQNATIAVFTHKRRENETQPVDHPLNGDDLLGSQDQTRPGSETPAKPRRVVSKLYREDLKMARAS